MSLVAHITMLRDKHARLESMIDDESHRPMPDFSVIQTLKKQKLLIKEEMERIDLTKLPQQSGGAA